MNVEIASGIEKALIDHAANEAPLEACGLLIGRPGHILKAVPARNVALDPARSFEIDPALLLATHRSVRSEGLRVLGHYHSHPNGSHEPSKRDAARALEDGALWLIVTAGTVSAWQASAAGTVRGRFLPITLERR